METWLDLIGYKGYYQASNTGYIKSLDRTVPFINGGSAVKYGMILEGTVNDKGYLRTKLCMGESIKSVRIHRIIAQTWIPNPNNLPEVNHKDGNKLNNAVFNLEWCTRKSNMEHAYNVLKIQTTHVGSKNHKSRIVLNTENGIFYDSITEAANTFGLKPLTLRSMLAGINPNITSLIFA